MNTSQKLLSLHLPPCPPPDKRGITEEKTGDVSSTGLVGGRYLVGFRDYCRLIIPLLDVKGFGYQWRVWSQKSCRLHVLLLVAGIVLER